MKYALLKEKGFFVRSCRKCNFQTNIQLTLTDLIFVFKRRCTSPPPSRLFTNFLFPCGATEERRGPFKNKNDSDSFVPIATAIQTALLQNIFVGRYFHQPRAFDLKEAANFLTQPVRSYPLSKQLLRTFLFSPSHLNNLVLSTKSFCALPHFPWPCLSIRYFKV